MSRCIYCNNVFTNNKTLSRHQKEAKYCLKLQGKTHNVYICTCGKEYTLLSSLNRHRDSCPEYQNKHTDQNIALQDIIKQYENIIHTLCSKKDIHNNRSVVLNNLQPITDDDIKDTLDYLTLDIIQLGPKGYADYANSYPFKDKLICTDRSRKKIRYKTSNGDISDDSRKLAKNFFQAISEKNTTLLNNACSDIHEEIKLIIAENRVYDSDITSLLSKASMIQDMLIRTGKAANGLDDEFTQEFITHVIKKL